MKILIILFFSFIVLLIILLLAYIIKNKSAGHNNTAGHLHRYPAALDLWTAINNGINKIETTKEPQHETKATNGQEWRVFYERQAKIVELLKRLQKYIERNPVDAPRIADVEPILPVVYDLFHDYNASLSFGYDTPGGKSFINYAREGLDGVEGVLNHALDALFQDKGISIHAEVEILLGKLDTVPRRNA